MKITPLVPRHNRVIIATHAMTDENSRDVLHGWDDISLNQHGKQAAELLAKKLERERADGIISSDLRRALQTASLCTGPDLPLLGVTMHLRTWDIGSLKGQDLDDTKDEIKWYIEEKPDDVVTNGESFNVFKHRLLWGVVTLLETYSNKDIVLLTHNRSERCIAAWLALGSPRSLDIDVKEMQKKGAAPGTFWTALSSDLLKR